MKIISEEKSKDQKQASFDQDADDHGIVGLLICLVVTLMFINGKFLEPYISVRRNPFYRAL